MADAVCARCGKEPAGLGEAPYDSQLGKKVQEQVCEACWQAWVAQQLMLMNEYRLDPMNDQHSKFLDEQMTAFLSLQ
jgi:Fe-S cluster biosynthesis and repair protein YggX